MIKIIKIIGLILLQNMFGVTIVLHLGQSIQE